jgi:NADH dehydrogenase
LLPAFPEPLAEQARRDLATLGVDVRTSTLVTGVDAGGVTVRRDGGEERVRARTVFWAAGNTGSPIARTLGAPLNAVGCVEVLPDLSVPGHPEVFVIGDLAALVDAAGVRVPGVAQGAIQEGRWSGENIARRLTGQPTRPFRYSNLGSLATIGRAKAIADLPHVRLTGFVAWLFWLFVHIMNLVGFRNRLSVLLQWAYAYFTYERGVRIIGDVNADRKP